MKIIDDGSCFACGKNNEIGLKLRFKLDREKKTAITETTIESHFSGWVNAVHGGIICTLLDEAMVYACASTGLFVATGTISVKFRKPVPTTEMLTIEGQVLEHRRKVMKTCAKIMRDGVVLAEAEGVMMVVGETDPDADYDYVG